MAGCAVINDAGMIEHSANEGTGIVANTAILIGRHMSACFARGEYAIMTGLAIIHDSCVIKCRW